jgi:MscS family membrane protein
MIKDVLIALDNVKIKDFMSELNKIVEKNMVENKKYLDVDYKPYLEIGEENVLAKAKTNIQEFYDLIEINNDVINHIYSFEKRMYRLNKYSKYHMIGAVVYTNHTTIGKIINPILEYVGLNIIKVLFILSLSLFLYFIRTALYVMAEKYFIKIDLLEKYSKDILVKSQKPLSLIILLINIEFVIYIYNDFLSVENLNRSFNVMYTFLFIWMFYRIINIVAKIKILEIDTSNIKIKYEMVNVGRKIINFLIVVIGLLFILYFAGTDLTAVLSGLGIGGLAVALAAKDSLSNFFGTVSILGSDVFSQGDWIVIDGEEGVVIEIGLRVTTLRTFDNALIAIPNATLANKDVKNWNKRTLGRRIKMSLAVKYSSKSEDIKSAVDEIRDMLEHHPRIATKNTQYTYLSSRGTKLVSKDDLQGVKKTLLVYLDEFSDSSINILVYCFSKSVDWEDWLQTKEDVMHKIMAILDKNNLEFAFPSLSIYNEVN